MSRYNNNFRAAQASYDAMLPPEYDEPEEPECDELSYDELSSMTTATLDGSDFEHCPHLQAEATRRLERCKEMASSVLAQWPTCQYCGKPLEHLTRNASLVCPACESAEE